MSPARPPEGARTAVRSTEVIQMSDTAYHTGMRELQDRFDTRRLADRLDERLGRGAFREEDRAFIESRTLFFLATADAEGRPDCSYKGGHAGIRTRDRARRARVPELRRQRPVPQPREHARQSRRSGCCSSTSNRRDGCASTARRRCSTIPRRWHATTARSWSCACVPCASSRTARATSIAAPAARSRPTCRGPATNRRPLRGSRWRSWQTCCRSRQAAPTRLDDLVDPDAVELGTGLVLDAPHRFGIGGFVFAAHRHGGIECLARQPDGDRRAAGAQRERRRLVQRIGQVRLGIALAQRRRVVEVPQLELHGGQCEHAFVLAPMEFKVWSVTSPRVDIVARRPKLRDTAMRPVLLRGIYNSGPAHWQSIWQE